MKEVKDRQNSGETPIVALSGFSSRWRGEGRGECKLVGIGARKAIWMAGKEWGLLRLLLFPSQDRKHENVLQSKQN